LQSEVGRAIKEMRDKKIIGDDVPGDVLRLLGFQNSDTTINNTNDTGEWPKDFTEVTVIALQKKPKATICNDHCTNKSHFTYSKGA
jgi:hypothetical protein